MNTVIHKPITPGEYSNKDLQKASFRDEDLSGVDFSGSDLRGANLGGSNLIGANFSNVRTGIPIMIVVWLFLLSVVASLLSGYIAMLTGRTIQGMLKSGEPRLGAAGIIAIALSVFFIAYAWWKGGGAAIRNLIIPASVVALIIGLVAYFTGVGTGEGMAYLILSNILLMVMFIIGTVARAAAGSLSNILFLIVALSGGMFGKSVGGGIGTVVMALACMQISKRALDNVPGFEGLRKIAASITRRYGTSFRDAKLQGANFAHSQIRSADFSNTDFAMVNWGDSRKINCLINGKIVTEKKKKSKSK
jgi:uncharacterized protein YjbI with pentapeptide repeats